LRGQSEILWLGMVLSITLIIVSLSVSPLSGAVTQAIKTSARLNAQRMGSAINILQTSPDGTCYAHILPKNPCKVVVSSKSVTFAMESFGNFYNYTMDLIQGVPVNNITIYCDPNNEKTIYAVRFDDRINLTERLLPLCIT